MKAINRPLIMLIDDSEIDIFINNKMLRVSGISDNVIAFSNVKEALYYISLHSENSIKLPNVILLDILMPEMNGFDFLESFKNFPTETKQKIKVIMVSSTVDPIDRERALKNLHVLDILQKPLDPERLKNILSRCEISHASVQSDA